MKNLKNIFYITILTNTIINLNADNRIIIYLRNAPAQTIIQAQKEFEKQKDEKLKKLSQKTPNQISKKLIKNEFNKYLIPKISGFLALYTGYSDYSDPDGLIRFPLRHVTPKLYLVITKKINPAHVMGQTISHLEFETEKNENKKIYLFEKQQDKNNQYFWKVSEKATPKDKRISPISIVLITNPKNIYVPLGDFITDDSKHLILPNVYVVGNINNNQILLNMVNMLRYFEPIDIKDKKVSDTLLQNMITNM
ncbi:hypothetical protein KAT08_04545 [Candidatus Babeliales bacterium]|nr:hypothetical protein [Candidatus Babeliales bacterium]